MTNFESPYHSEEAVKNAIVTGNHREFVGGHWEELGRFQLAFLESLGLKPEHRFLDVGCGALRGGVHFARYLEAGNYYGQDLLSELIEAGYNQEIIPANLDQKVPRKNLYSSEEFDFSAFDARFDYALAFSVFTHLSLNNIRICLEKIHPFMNENGKFVATFFERSPYSASYIPAVQPPGIITSHGGKDPYHYTIADLEHAAAGLPLRVKFIGDIGHLRGQKAVIFEKIADKKVDSLRSASLKDAAALPPGADHYRAYVGPPERFDIMSASQFALLFQLGLRDFHSVLDFGCGSLRLGRLLIPFLQSNRYFGIDPNAWLIEEGIAREIGESALRLKSPCFDYNEKFDCEVFGEKFDFIVAQSIVTHTDPEMTKALFASVSNVLKDNGLFVFSYINSDVNSAVAPATEGWHYPHCVSYSEAQIQTLLASSSLFARPLPWHHPGASWFIAANSADAIPGKDALELLNGRSLR